MTYPTSPPTAWTILKNAFGNPLTHLNFWLGIMKATKPQTYKVITTDPNRAAVWFLQYEKAMETILRLGDRSNTLRIQ